VGDNVLIPESARIVAVASAPLISSCPRPRGVITVLITIRLFGCFVSSQGAVRFSNINIIISYCTWERETRCSGVGSSVFIVSTPRRRYNSNNNNTLFLFAFLCLLRGS